MSTDTLAENDLAETTISVTDLLLLAVDAKLGRLTEATERLADAVEALTGLFASVIGRADAACSGHDGPHYTAVNFIRSGHGNKSFACDADASETDHA
ncbi:hypothetical protein OZ411_28740 [Bradyrhizobium sp. Arg237L]|uniref:hypothetical protein n=1 Tax=Bradyrhizobium sp. Arg237L TaxID=3003352 RepID=UPI00249F6714|nr:hypothetical protein [Bradyrhizobium sp. Arg237L]MDI4236805.1 hypothetical protein [Bradyrhizobium sp. Arg237L]